MTLQKLLYILVGVLLLALIIVFLLYVNENADGKLLIRQEIEKNLIKNKI